MNTRNMGRLECAFPDVRGFGRLSAPRVRGSWGRILVTCRPAYRRSSNRQRRRLANQWRRSSGWPMVWARVRAGGSRGWAAALALTGSALLAATGTDALGHGGAGAASRLAVLAIPRSAGAWRRRRRSTTNSARCASTGAAPGCGSSAPPQATARTPPCIPRCSDSSPEPLTECLTPPWKSERGRVRQILR